MLDNKHSLSHSGSKLWNCCALHCFRYLLRFHCTHCDQLPVNRNLMHAYENSGTSSCTQDTTWNICSDMDWTPSSAVSHLLISYCTGSFNRVEIYPRLNPVCNRKSWLLLFKTFSDGLIQCLDISPQRAEFVLSGVNKDRFRAFQSKHPLLTDAPSYTESSIILFENFNYFCAEPSTVITTVLDQTSSIFPILRNYCFGNKKWR